MQQRLLMIAANWVLLFRRPYQLHHRDLWLATCRRPLVNNALRGTRQGLRSQLDNDGLWELEKEALRLTCYFTLENLAIFTILCNQTEVLNQAIFALNNWIISSYHLRPEGE